MKRKVLEGTSLIAISSFLAIVLVELCLTIFADESRFYPHYPNTVRYSYPNDKVTPGVSGTTKFSTNGFGTRGPEFAGTEQIRILTIGGSTTADTILDDRETWAYLLGENLRHRSNVGIWVTNSGIDGLNSHHHLMHAKYLLPQLPKIDYVIVHAGINDLGLWFHHEQFDASYLDDPSNWENRIGEAFRSSNYTPNHWPIYKKTQLWKLASRLKSLYLSSQASENSKRKIIQDKELKWLQEERNRRNNAPQVLLPKAKLASLPIALESYKNSLKRLIEEIEEQGAKPVFMAQVVQSKFATQEERDRLWMGELSGNQGYVSEDQYPILLNRFNLALKEVAVNSEIHFIDLPQLVSNDASMFYDGMHFSEHGASEVAKAVSDFFITNIL